MYAEHSGRSRSSSMSSGHSHSSMSSSSLRLSSPSAMSTSSNATSTYASIPRSIPRTVIIDETTSDVPSISEGLMRSFVPKIEDTCSDSGIYTMNSLINNRVPGVINDSTSPLLSKTSSLMSENTTSIMGQRLPLINADVTSMINNRPSMVPNGPMPVINEVSSISTENKFIPPNYVPTNKSVAPEMNWMMNQPAGPSSGFMPEQNFENWLGQIFKSDNLTPGCSLPQGQVENVNYV